MTVTRTARSIRNVLLIAAALALVVLPAAAAVQTHDSAPTAADGTLVADGSVAAAPAVADGVSAADDSAAESPAETTARDGGDTSSAPAATAEAAVAAVPSDESGSTEAAQVSRSCGASADSHYVPASGKDSSQCYDKDGKFQSSRKYTATHYTNDVDCGNQNKLPGAAGTDVYSYGTAGADGGYLSACSERTVPVHGRATARADADGSAEVVWDGDKDNQEEVSQGWADATVSGDGPEYRCGQAYSDGGRGTADAPTSQDNADQCSP